MYNIVHCSESDIMTCGGKDRLYLIFQFRPLVIMEKREKT